MSTRQQRRGLRHEHARSNFNEWVRRRVAGGRIFPYLAGITVALALSAGVIVRIIDHKDFDTLGNSMWWSIVTLTTVGYGDIVPHSTWGRLVGAGVMILGITFLSILTATVTSYFVSANQDDFAADVAEAAERDEAGDIETHRLLQELLDRVNVIEGKLDGRSQDEP